MRGYPLDHPNRYALQLLAVVLGGGMSSRLFTEVTREAWPRLLRPCGNTAYTDVGTFYSSAGVDVARVDEAITTILGELRKIAEEVPPTSSSARVREGPLRAPPREPAGDDSVRAAQGGARGRDREPDELLRKLDEVTVEDVQRVARDLFEDKRLYLAVVGPFDDPARFEKLIAA